MFVVLALLRDGRDRRHALVAGLASRVRGADGETLDGRRDGGDGGDGIDDGNGIVRAIEPKRVARSFVRSIHSFIRPRS